MKQDYKSMLGRWGLEGWFSAACQAMGASDPRVFQMKMWKVEMFMGSSEADIDSGARTPESLSPKVLHAYPSGYSLRFCPIWTFVPGQGIIDQTRQQWKHSRNHPTGYTSRLK